MSSDEGNRVGRTIGAASDFYRLRITRMDQSEEPDLEWRDDILYRTPPNQRLREADAFAIEAVSVDDEDDVTLIAVYGSSDEAYAALGPVEDDLGDLTKSAFENRYLVSEG